MRLQIAVTCLSLLLVAVCMQVIKAGSVRVQEQG